MATTQKKKSAKTTKESRDNHRSAREAGAPSAIPPIPFPPNGQQRVVISGVTPEIDAGRFPIKRVVGEEVAVEADAFADGHDQISCWLLVRGPSESQWHEYPMNALGNDRWRGAFRVTAMGTYHYCITAGIDAFRTWRNDLIKRIEAKQDISVDLLIGANHVESAAGRASGEDAARLKILAEAMRNGSDPAVKVEIALSEELSSLAHQYPDREHGTTYPRELRVHVDRPKARFSAWYEMFPRSASPQPGRHGTLRDCEARLDYIAYMGFDVLYLPPIHPVGRKFRKGPNNDPQGGEDAVGSPWGIGAEEGGHDAIHPELGTTEDLRNLMDAASKRGIEIALDIAWQCSPDHPYVKSHPQWFRQRPDGTIQYAENPPKKYQDIYPVNFETTDWQALWTELRRVVRYWIDLGIRIFRVDNPHTKPFPFWEWLIDDIHRDHPDVLFLSEAFTRPKVMYELAKRGFTQSYTYFAWRNVKWEIKQYMTELTRTEVAEYFRPNFWPNTPDILNEYLQTGGRPAFMIRLILAATLTASYGIYGPAFELCEHIPRNPGSEEYLHSEKYEIRQWNLDAPHSLKELIALVNRARREHPALQSNDSLVFHGIDNDRILLYSKSHAESQDRLLMAVNLDPHHAASGWTQLDLGALGLDPGASYQVHDLLTDQWFTWSGDRNYILLDPHTMPAHMLRIQPRPRSERDYEQYK